MTTRTLTIEVDAPSPRQRPIDRTEVSLRSNPEFDWSYHDAVAGEGVHEMVFENVQPGMMYYQVITYDDQNTPSNAVVVSAEAEWDAPSDPTVTVTDSD